MSILVCCAFTSATRAERRQEPRLPGIRAQLRNDSHLGSYKQLAACWQKLDRESDRMVLQSISKTAEGRGQLMAIVTSPENHKNPRGRTSARQLALAEG